MKVLYFYQYFSTSNGSWGTRVHEFTREWVKSGHEVTVVTSIYSKSDLQAEKFIENQIIDGVRVKIINVKIDNKQSFLRRILGFLTYSIVSSWYAISIKADIVVASSGPITVGIPGLLAKIVRRRKLVFEVRDLWPDGAIELGFLKNKAIQRLAFKLEKMCYRKADLIVALSPGMRDEIIKKSSHKNVISVTNSANIELFSTPCELNTCVGLLESRKYALYTGNIGMVNNVSWMFEAAKLLTQMGRSDIKIVWIGDGQLKAHFTDKKKDGGIDNLIILDLIPKKDLIPIVQHALICLAPLNDTKILSTSSPNKFFEALAAGVPVIQTTDGWMKDFLIEHNVGFTIDPNNPIELAEILEKLFDGEIEITEMSKKAASVARERFDKNLLAGDMLNAILKVVD
jgi:glycosyltransferase involved in cell wall biosynthesis